MLWAFAACTSMTMRMYARRKGGDYGTTQVTLRHERIHAHDRASCVTEDGYVDRLHRESRLDPALPPEQRAALLAICGQVPRPPHPDQRGRGRHHRPLSTPAAAGA